MSSMYVVEPPTTGKVVISTNAGDIDIELWCKEAPKACRNFIQLCQEGYYDGTIFHRVIKDFMVQGGDPTGTGNGGDSIYGEPFKDEFHQRLKFNHRGQVAMANGGENDNGSQFFITLDKCENLNRKHTIFGKITGNTIFNVLQWAELPVDSNDRPEDPPRILKTETIISYFDDIVVREDKVKRPEVEAKKKRKRKVKGTKNFKLMSFGEEAEDDEEQTVAATSSLGKIKSFHDVVRGHDDKSEDEDEYEDEDRAEGENNVKEKYKSESTNSHEIQAEDMESRTVEATKTDKNKAPESDDEKDFDAMMRAKLERKRVKEKKKEAKEQKKFMTAEERIRASREEQKQLLAEMKQPRSQTDENDETSDIQPRSEAQKFLDEQNAKYETTKDLKKNKGKRQDRTMELLAKFQSKLASVSKSDDEESPVPSDDEEYDKGWMKHTLRDAEYDKFESIGIDPSLDPNSLSIEDPRNPLVKRRREASKQKAKEDRRASKHARMDVDRRPGAGYSRDRDRDRDRDRSRNRDRDRDRDHGRRY